MSIKKDNLTHYANLAFEQAKINLGSTNKNPSVGCVVEKNGAILSSGHTSLYGRPHAEYNALNRKINFEGSNMFVSLEPCSHYGKTPPCTNLIIKKKIKKVYFSINDSDKRSSNKAKSIFKKNNIKTSNNLLTEFAKFFYKNYLDRYKNSLPLIDAKIALSNDYYSISKKKKWITNKHSRRRVHFLRSTYDAIISTSKTINEDNSRLNCRIEGLEKKSPVVVIIDKYLTLKKNLNIFKSSKKIYMITASKNRVKQAYFKKKNVTIIYNQMHNNNDYLSIFSILKEKGFSRILIESGLTFLNFLISETLLNNVYVFLSREKLLKNGSNNSKNDLIKKLKLNNRLKVNLFNDKLYKVKLKDV